MLLHNDIKCLLVRVLRLKTKEFPGEGVVNRLCKIGYCKEGIQGARCGLDSLARAWLILLPKDTAESTEEGRPLKASSCAIIIIISQCLWPLDRLLWPFLSTHEKHGRRHPHSSLGRAGCSRQEQWHGRCCVRTRSQSACLPYIGYPILKNPLERVVPWRGIGRVVIPKNSIRCLEKYCLKGMSK